MARYRGPRLKIIRRFGQHLPGLSRKSAENRPYPPGQHGVRRRSKPSDYRIRLEEKQKLRLNYGISERQLRKYFHKASASDGDTGQNLLNLLESRLDNFVFRSGYVATIPAARQLVSHGHVLVNNRRLDIPSYKVKVGDILSLKEKSKKNVFVNENFSAPVLEIPDYINRNTEKLESTFISYPTREDIPLEIQENLIVEYYSRVA